MTQTAHRTHPTEPTEREQRDRMVLLVGLLMVLLLQGIAFLAAAAAPVLGLMLGALELLIAWRVPPTSRVSSLRWLLAAFGVVTLVLSVVYLAT